MGAMDRETNIDEPQPLCVHPVNCNWCSWCGLPQTATISIAKAKKQPLEIPRFKIGDRVTVLGAFGNRLAGSVDQIEIEAGGSLTFGVQLDGAFYGFYDSYGLMSEQQPLESAAADDFNSSAASKDGGFLERLDE